MSLSKIFIRPVTFRATEDATEPSSVASVNVTGGLVIKKSTYIAENLVTGGTATFTSGVKISEDLDMSSKNIKNVADPVDVSDAVNKSYFDAKTYNPVQSHITSVGTLSQLSVSGRALFTDTTDTISPINGGSALFSGGIGVKSTLWVGGTQGIKMSNTVGPVITKDVNRFSTGLYTNTGSSGLFYESGDLVTLATMNLGSSVFNGVQFAGYNSDSTLTSWMTIWSYNGTVSIKGTTDSTSSITGVLQVAGGVGVGGSIYTGSDLASRFLKSTYNVINSNFICISSQTAVNGVGTGIYFHSSNQITVFPKAAFLFERTGTNGLGNLHYVTRTGTDQSLVTIADSKFQILSTGEVIITSTTDSTSTTSGALQIKGGAGIGKILTVAKQINIGDAIDSTTAIRNFNLMSSDAVLRIWRPTADPSVELITGTVTTNPGDSSNSHWDFFVSNPNKSFTIRDRSSGVNRNRLTIGSDGNVLISSTTDSSSLTTGALQVSGGVGLGGSISIGKSWRMFGATSGSVSIAAPATVTSYSLILPSTVAPANNYALVSDISGNLSWSQMITANPSFTTASITSSTNSTSTTSGALQVTGGVGVGGSLYAGNMFIGTNAVATQAYVTGFGYITSSALTPYLTSATAASTTYLTSSSAATYQPVITAGTGLTKSGNTLSVNAAQTQITSVGTLTGLTSSGTVSITSGTVSNSTISGALQVTGGVGVGGSVYAGNMFIGTNAVATQAYVTGLGYITSSALTPYLTSATAASTYLTTSSAASTYLTTSSASSTYQPIITAGTGLTKTGNTLSVNAAQTQITSVGTLTGLTSSGTVSITSTTDSLSTASGALQVA